MLPSPGREWCAGASLLPFRPPPPRAPPPPQCPALLALRGSRGSHGDALQGREGGAGGQPGGGVPELVEVRVPHRLLRGDALLGRVGEEFGEDVQAFEPHRGAENLVQGVPFDLGELELRVVRVHAVDLLPRGGAQHLDDLHQLVHPALPAEHGAAQDELRHDATDRPDVDGRGVVGGPEDELRGPVVAAADVRYVRLPFLQLLRRPEVAQLEPMGLGVHQQVLRFDVAVADRQAVQVRQRRAQLVHVELDTDDGRRPPGLACALCAVVYGVRHELEH
mmetsp:Transcript_18308/g.51672  ORF Transcript_18308/g.51672 Transcript_18308/m.51672 type:complete len:278 (+) Transcript_18308:235-1068(+)